MFGTGIWSHEALLDAVVLLDDRVSAHAVSGTAGDAASFSNFDGTATLAELAGRLRTGTIGRDRAVRLADRIEHWYDAHARA